MDLAADLRRHEPARLSVGPVLAVLDAVATKVATVFSRGEARDYLDLAGILDSGRFSPEELITLASGVDGGFSREMFAEALVAIDRFPDEEFVGYGVDAARISRVREMMRDWSRALQHEANSGSVGHESTGSSTAPLGDPRRADARDRQPGDDPGAADQRSGQRQHRSPRPAPRQDLGAELPSSEPPPIDL